MQHSFALLLLLMVSPLAAQEVAVDLAAHRLTLPLLKAEPENVSEAKKEEAEKWYQKALESARNKQGYEAMRFVIRALEINPDHETARKIVGEKIHDGFWRGEWEIDRLKRGYVDHERFGWIRRDFVERYEKGERYDAQSKKWAGAAEDARRHDEMRNAWVISTEHYDVHTNHSLEEGVRCARQLEHLNRAWRLLFFNMVYTESQLARWILNPPRAPSQPRHRVLVYRDRADYNAQLKVLEPQIARTNGFYCPPTATAYFFPVSESMEAFVAESTRKAMFHEATHQLFQESKSRRNQEHPRINYWAVEGIAMLMETFSMDHEKSQYVIGDITDTRIFAAKVYWERDCLFVPSAQLVRFGAVNFPTRSSVYAQSAGLVHLLMFENAGQDRAALLELLRKAYEGTSGPHTLEKLLERPYEELDKEYQDFLTTVP